MRYSMRFEDEWKYTSIEKLNVVLYTGASVVGESKTQKQ